jgi:ornithine carbamoyltransferase
MNNDLLITYVGDGNNMANSWINAVAKLPFHLDLACPDGYDPEAAILKWKFYFRG